MIGDIVAVAFILESRMRIVKDIMGSAMVLPIVVIIMSTSLSMRRKVRQSKIRKLYANFLVMRTF